jgi:translocation and assembly module TamA
MDYAALHTAPAFSALVVNRGNYKAGMTFARFGSAITALRSRMFFRRATCRSIFVLSLAILSLAAPNTRAAETVAYTLKIAHTGNAALDAAIAGSSQLNALRTKAPASPFALVSRARADTGRLHAALDSFGYYEAKVGITIDGKGLDDPSLPDTLAALPGTPPTDVDVSIETGPLFHLRHVIIDGDIPAQARPAFTLKPGDPAVAGIVLRAAEKLLNALQEDGYAMARVPPPQATEIPADHALDVTFQVTAGPRVDLGPIAITGLKVTNLSYVRRRLMLHQGEQYKPSAIEAARQDLISSGIFAGVKISAAPELDSAGQLPLRVDVSERARRSVTLNLSYSTDLGASAGVTWTYRNVFGNAEQLNLTADLTGLGGSDSTGEGYLAKAQFTKPDFFHRDQTLELDIEAIRQDLDTYDQTAAIASAGISRKLSPQWTVGIGLTGTQETILQQDVSRNYTLLAVPVSAKFDSTDVKEPFDDPTHGIRAALVATPTESFSSQDSTFFIFQGTASTYVDLHSIGLAPPAMTVLAFRGIVGTVQGATDLQLPPDQRFYAGGSGTIRGFKYQSAGPLFPDSTPEGGTAIDTATIELRQRVWHDIGIAVFGDAGQVSTSSAPFQGAVYEGVGIGARYYTSIGPIRLDFAVPLDRPPGGDSFEIYLGIGQAF